MEQHIPIYKSELDEAELEHTSGGVGGLSLKSRGAKLNSQNSAVDAGMKEAGEKASNAMDAANTALTTGIIGGIIQKSSS